MKKIILFILIFYILPITIYAQCNASFTLTGANTCAPVTSTLNASASTGTNLTYTWDFDDGTPNQTTANPITAHAFDAVGGANETFQVKLTVNNQQGCVHDTIINFTIKERPEAKLSQAELSPCDNDTATITIFDITGQSNLSSHTIEWGNGTPTNQTITAPFPANGVSHFYNPGIHSLIYTVTNTSNCEDSTHYVVANINNPDIGTGTVLGYSLEGCAPHEICFLITTYSNNHPSTVYEVDYGDGTIEYFNHPPPDTVCHVYDSTSCLSPNDEFEFVVSAINACKPVSVTVSTIEIHTGPEPIIGVPNGGCDGSSISFQNLTIEGYNSICDGFTQYSWDFGDPTSGGNNTIATNNNNNVNHVFSGPGTYTITLEAINGCGTYTTTETIEIVGPAMADFSIPTLSDTCTPVSFTLQNNSTGNLRTHLWQWYKVGQNPNNTDMSILTNPTLTFTEPGQWTIKLTTTNPCGSTTHFDTISLGSPPLITINPIPEACDSSIVDFSQYVTIDSFGQPLQSIVWTFQNASISSYNGVDPPNVTFYNSPAIVSVTATNSCGSTTVADTFSIFQTPIANASYSLSQSCYLGTPLTLSTTNSSIGDTMNYTWRLRRISPSFSNITAMPNANAFEPTFTINAQGTYELKLTVTNPNCPGVSDVWIDTLDISSTPSVTISNVNSFYCDTAVVFPTTNLPEIGTIFLWEFTGADNLTTSTDATPGPVIFTGQGQRKIKVTVTTSCGVASDSIVFDVYDTPIVNAGIDEIFCSNEGQVTLTGFSPTGGTWSSSPFISFSGASFNTTSISPVQYTATYTIDNNGCAGTDTKIIDIFGINSGAGNDLTVCVGSPAITLVGTPLGGTWSGIAGNVNAINPNGDYNPANAGVDEVFYTYQDTVNGCSASSSIFITVDNLPIPAFAIPDTICANALLIPTNNSLDLDNSIWKYNGTSSTGFEPNIIFNNCDTIENIKLIAIDQNGCQDSITQSIYIECDPTAIFSKDTIIGCAELMVNFMNQSTGTSLEYIWEIDTLSNINSQQLFTSTSTDLIFTFPQGEEDTTAYLVTLKAINRCDTSVFVDTVFVISRPIIRFGPNVDDGCSPLPIFISNIITSNTTQYDWDMGNDSIYTNTQYPPTQIYTTDTTRNFTITLMASNQCGSEIVTDTILVKPNDIDAFFYTDTTSGCVPFSIELIDFTEGVTQIIWDIESNPFGGVAAAFDTITHTFTLPGIYIIKEYVYNGCSRDTTEIFITVHPAPDVDINASDVLICKGDTVDFSAITNNSIINYSYDFGDGFASLLSNPMHRFDSVGTFTTVLTVTADSTGCTNSDAIDITVSDLPIVSFMPDILAGCPPLTVNFTNTSGGDYYTWEVIDSSGQPLVFSTQYQDNYVFPIAGIYTVRLTVEDIQGCKESQEVTITVHPRAISDFSYVVENSCSLPDTAFFTNLSTNATIYQWDLAIGNSMLPNPQAIYTTANLYPIQLISNNQYNCADTSQQTIEIRDYPNINIGLSQVRNCRPMPVDFTNQSIGHQFTWSYGVNNSSSMSTVPTTFVYDTVGFFNLTFQALDTINGCMVDTTIVMDIGEIPISNFIYGIDNSCNLPDTATFTNLSSFADNYDWDFGIGTDTMQNPQAIYTTPNSYTVQLIASNSYNCADTSQQTIEIRDYPNINIGLSQVRNCRPMPVDFTNQSIGHQFTWNYGVNNAGSMSTIPTTFVYDTIGFFNLTFQALDTINGCMVDTTIVMDIGAKPLSAFTYDIPENCQQPTLVNFQSQATGTTSHHWNFTNLANLNPSTYYGTSGFKTAALIVDNSYNCPDTSTQMIRIYPALSLEFDIDQVTVCPPSLAIFNSLSDSANVWHWQFDNLGISDFQNPTFSFPNTDSANAIIYDIWHYATQDSVCFDSIQQQLIVLPAPVASFTFNDLDSTGWFDFTNLSLPTGLLHHWNFGDGDSSTMINPRHRYTSVGGKTVELIVTNTEGCKDTAIAPINPAFFDLYVPNSLIPGTQQDGVRLFLPKGAGIETYRLRIFAKNGQLVFESSELNNGEPAIGWDGTDINTGKPLPMDVYIWQIEATFMNGLLWQQCNEKGNCSNMGTLLLIR